ncbi:MAG TPA: protein kinase [Kofleriaceae bacterium]|nr:protein kinase [Kofleriaceae bacterium]
MECLDDNLASEFVSGSMATTTQTKVEKHLATCRDCRELVAALAGPGDDSDVATHPRNARDGLTESQAGKLPALSIGDRVGRYLVLSTLGAGGMGMVFAAYDPQLDRKIALKVLRTNLGANTAEARKRLKREAQAIARLNHPNVVGVYDVGTTTSGEDVYIAMEFVEGDTLTTWLKRYPRTYREILEVFHQAGRGLMAAHSVGLLHRDFKPDNVLVGSDGRVRVTDFGLARSLFGFEDSNRGPTAMADAAKLMQVDLTATGTVLGTPRYMPPEQLQGPNIDARSDQFSFCVALYEALYAKHPLHDATSVAMLERGTPAEPPPADARVPSKVGRAVMRGLSRERSDRFAAMAELMTELAPPEPRPRLRMAVTIAAMTILLGGATAAIVVTRPRTPPEGEQETFAVKALVDEINQLRSEVKTLRLQLTSSAQDTKEARALLAVKEQMIDSLTDQVQKMRESKPPASSQPPPPPSQSAMVTQAVASAQHDLEGCFDEWSSRPLEAESIGSAHSLARGSDSDVLVALSVAADGTASEVEAKGEDILRSPSLKFCVESAIERVKYPAGHDALELSVAVAWAAPNMVSMSARVVGHHPATAQPLTP